MTVKLVLQENIVLQEDPLLMVTVQLAIIAERVLLLLLLQEVQPILVLVNLDTTVQQELEIQFNALQELITQALVDLY